MKTFTGMWCKDELWKIDFSIQELAYPDRLDRIEPLLLFWGSTNIETREKLNIEEFKKRFGISSEQLHEHCWMDRENMVGIFDYVMQDEGEVW